MKHLKTFNSFNEAMDINDPNLMRLRAAKHAFDSKPVRKMLSPSKTNMILDKIAELEERLLDLRSERKEVFMEMEAEAGMAGENWTDDDANRYGEELNRLEDELERVKGRIESLRNKLDESYLDFQQAASVAQDTEGAQRYEYGSNPSQMEFDFPKRRDPLEEPEEDLENPETFKKKMEDPRRKLDSIMTMAEIMRDLLGKTRKSHPYVTANLNDAYNSLRTAYLRTQDGF